MGASGASIDGDTAAWLVSDEAAELLAAAGETEDPVRRGKLLRRHVGPAKAAAASLQIDLRRRATAKFGPAAANMFFTTRGLEQATDAATAAYKASRFPAGKPAADLCCGVGGDAAALAVVRLLLAVDRDPTMATFAAANARAAGQSLTAVCTDVESVRLDRIAAWHIDPDRRPTGRRTSQLVASDPGIETLSRLLAAQPNAAVKLAPAAEVSHDWSRNAEREWISRGGDCRQQIAWFGSLATRPGECAATVLNDQGIVLDQLVGVRRETTVAERLGDFLIEPDPAVLAAGLAGAMADVLGARALTPGGGYLTSDAPATRRLLTSYRVLDATSPRATSIAVAAAEHGVAVQAVKKRGLELQPERLLREIKRLAKSSPIDGQGVEGVVICLKWAGRPLAVLAIRA